MLCLLGAKGQYICQGGDVCLNLPTKPVSLPPPQVCLYRSTHREDSRMCYPPILSVTEWQEAKLVGCSWRSRLLIRGFRQGSDHCGYSPPPPTAAECGKASPASSLPPPSGAEMSSPVAFTDLAWSSRPDLKRQPVQWPSLTLHSAVFQPLAQISGRLPSLSP